MPTLAKAACLVALVLGTPALCAQPPAPLGARSSVFADLDLPAAARRADAQGRLLVVAVSADWCVPCHTMARTVWPDPAVADWLDRHAVAIELDLDENQHLPILRRSNALPLMIALADGREVSRTIGSHSAPRLLRWLRHAADAQAAHESLVRQTLDQASQSLAANNLDAAAEHYLWLVDHLPQAQQRPASLGRDALLAPLASLASTSPKARARIERARASLTPIRDAPARSRWLLLSRALGDDDAILSWVDRNIAFADADPAATGTPPNDLTLVADLLAPVLVEHDRSVALARARTDPRAWMTAAHARITTGRPDELAGLTRQVIAIHRGLILLDRDQQAADLRAHARAILADPALDAALLDAIDNN